jgi:hypothetical protein
MWLATRGSPDRGPPRDAPATGSAAALAPSCSLATSSARGELQPKAAGIMEGTPAGMEGTEADANACASRAGESGCKAGGVSLAVGDGAGGPAGEGWSCNAAVGSSTGLSATSAARAAAVALAVASPAVPAEEVPGWGTFCSAASLPRPRPRERPGWLLLPVDAAEAASPSWGTVCCTPSSVAAAFLPRPALLLRCLLGAVAAAEFTGWLGGLGVPAEAASAGSALPSCFFPLPRLPAALSAASPLSCASVGTAGCSSGTPATIDLHETPGLTVLLGSGGTRARLDPAGGGGGGGGGRDGASCRAMSLLPDSCWPAAEGADASRTSPSGDANLLTARGAVALRIGAARPLPADCMPAFGTSATGTGSGGEDLCRCTSLPAADGNSKAAVTSATSSLPIPGFPGLSSTGGCCDCLRGGGGGGWTGRSVACSCLLSAPWSLR